MTHDRTQKTHYGIQLCPGVAALAEAMQKKLERDHPKGSWMADGVTVKQLLDGLQKEVTELAGGQASDGPRRGGGRGQFRHDGR